MLLIPIVFYPNPPGAGGEDKREAGLTTPSITAIDRVEEPTSGAQGVSEEDEEEVVQLGMINLRV